MRIIKDIAQLSCCLSPCWRDATPIAFVPTMGNLHEGHLALVREAKRRASYVVVSLFVNPLQFAPGEDYDLYPRTLEADCKKLINEGGVDVVFAPSSSVLYPSGSRNMPVSIRFPGLEHELCGVSRPTFFSGVAMIVAKLLNLVRPQVAVFGEKDFQQLLVVRRLVQSLYYPVDVVAVPIVREPDGLAMSSRNAYLSESERLLAPKFYRALSAVKDELVQLRDVSQWAALFEKTENHLRQIGFAVDYLDVRYLKDLRVVDADYISSEPLIVLGAVHLGKTRLIDNVSFRRA